MGENSFSRTGRVLTSGDLDRVQDFLGYAIPESVRRHYSKWNGGTPARRFFLTRDGRELEINHFLPIGQRRFDRDITMEDSVERLVRTKHVIPEFLLPFAVNSGGDYYCIDRGDGAVIFYAMDQCLEPQRASHRVAESLDLFVEGMVTEEELYG
jgi:hypothetical protein